MTDPAGWLTPELLQTLRSGAIVVAMSALGDSHLAEDVAQETLARAVEAAREGRLTPDMNVSAYVAGIARHVVSHAHRSRKRHEKEPLGEPTIAEDPPQRLRDLLSRSEQRRLREAMSALSERDRVILRLSFFEDLDSSQIAARLGEPASRVRKRKSRALARLRRALLEGGHT